MAGLFAVIAVVAMRFALWLIWLWFCVYGLQGLYGVVFSPDAAGTMSPDLFARGITGVAAVLGFLGLLVAMMPLQIEGFGFGAADSALGCLASVVLWLVVGSLVVAVAVGCGMLAWTVTAHSVLGTLIAALAVLMGTLVVVAPGEEMAELITG